MSSFVFEFPESLLENVEEIVDVVCYGGPPIEITESRYHMTTKVWLWFVDNNIDDYEWDSHEGVIVFKNQNDFLLFKLTWL